MVHMKMREEVSRARRVDAQLVERGHQVRIPFIGRCAQIDDQAVVAVFDDVAVRAARDDVRVGNVDQEDLGRRGHAYAMIHRDPFC